MREKPAAEDDDVEADEHEDEDEEAEEADESENIVPSDRLAAQSSAQLEDELAKFRNEWKMELLLEKHAGSKPDNKADGQRRSNRMEHHELPSRTSAKAAAGYSVKAN